MSQQQLENTKETLETVKGKLETYQTNKDQTALDGITKHDLTGAILQAGVQSYFAVNDTQDIIAQRQAGVVQYPYLTYGTFSTGLTTITRYGILVSVKLGGVVMDIDNILQTKVEVNNDREKLTSYNLARGPSYSLNENLVPEQLFDDPNTEEKEAEGISAVKALSIAAQQGQTIYTITRENYSEVLPKLNHSDVVMTDIRNGISAGKTVTVHDSQINFHGWRGTGYTMVDMETGAGAYMIGGGLDGAFTVVFNYIYGFALFALASASDNNSEDLSTIEKIMKWLGAIGFKPAKYFNKFKKYLDNLMGFVDIWKECNFLDAFTGTISYFMVMAWTTLVIGLVSATASIIASVICRNILCGILTALFVIPYITSFFVELQAKTLDEILTKCKAGL